MKVKGNCFICRQKGQKKLFNQNFFMKNKTMLMALLLCIITSPAVAQLRSIQSIANGQITVIELAAGGEVWVGSKTGISHYASYPSLLTGTFNTANSLLQSDTVNAIALGTIAGIQYAFVGTPLGLAYIKDGVSNTVPNSVLPQPNITALFFSNTAGKTLWAFTTGAGAVVLDSNQAFLNTPPLPFAKYSSAQIGCTGYIAGSIDSGAAYSTDFIHDTLLQAPNLVSDSVTAVAIATNCAAYLVGTRGGFSFCPVGHTCQNYTTANSTLPENYITSVSQECNGSVWIGMKDSGIVVYNPPTQSFTRVSLPDSLSQITALATSTDSCTGINYIGTANGYVAIVDSSLAVVQVSDGVQAIGQGALSVQVYPQPAAGKVNFVFNNELNEQFSYSDMTGRILGSYDLKNINKFTLDISGLADGLYIYMLSDSGQMQKTGKFEVLK
jgi:ligand-binding sensor domain-containing protein